MSDEITITAMRKDHMDSIEEIERLSFSTPWSRALLCAELENPSARYFVAECGGKAVGYAGVLNICGEGNITNVAVHPGFRRRGVADRLLKALTEYADAHLELLTLEVRESNAPAISLYTKHGFKPVGRRKNYYTQPTEDGIIMERRSSKQFKLRWSK